MKKILLVGFVFLFSLSLSACGKSELPQKEATQKTEVKEKIVKIEDEDLMADEVEKNIEEGDVEEDGLENEKAPSEEESEVDNQEDEEAIMKKEEVIKPILAQQTLLILDASGSMWGQIDGKAKIEIAKEVVKKTVKSFENTELGLMAYGHRHKGDCEDIEILSAPKKGNAANISEMVDKISPMGMTPMGNSVLMAAESLKYTEQKATVILVSDGIETCDIDLCALGKKLEETGVDFTAHVIGFDMTEEQTAGLKCLASETGGTFTSAKNADDLGKALEESVEAVSCSVEKLGKALITAPSEVNANSEFKITWTGLNNEDDYIGIFPSDSSKWNDHLDIFTSLDTKNNKGTLTAPIKAGEYDIVYFAYCGETLGRTSLVVKKVSATLTIPETSDAGSKIDISWVGPNNSSDYIGIFPKNSTEWNENLELFGALASKNNQGTLTAPLAVGEYDVLYYLGQEEILARKTFSVQGVSASLTIPETADAGSRIDVSWIGPNNSGDYIGIFPKGSTEWNENMDVFGSLESKDGQDELTVPLEVGEYDVLYWQHQEEILARKTFAVKGVSATLTIPVDADAGSEINISWTGPNNSGDYIGVFPKGSTEWNENIDVFGSLDSKNGQGVLTVPLEAGEYDVLYWQHQEKILTRKTFVVQSVSASLDVPITVIKDTEFTITWTGPNNSGDYIGIFPKGSNEWNDHINIFSSLEAKNGQGTLDSPEEAGKYDLLYWQHQRKILTRKTFTVTD